MKVLALILGLAAALGVGVFIGSSRQVDAAVPTQGVASKSIRAPMQRQSQKLEASSALDLFLSGTGNDRQLLQALVGSLENATVAELETLHRELNLTNNFENWTEVSVARNLLFQRWAELDPDGAIEAAGNVHFWFREDAFSSIFKVLASEDPAASWQRAEAIASKPLARFAKNASLSAIAQHDPELALSYFEANSDLDASGLFINWSKSDPTAALAASKVLKGTNLKEIQAGIIGRLYREDPDAAFSAAEALTGPGRREAYGMLLKTMASADPWQAAAWASEDLQRFSDNELSEFAAKLSEDDALKAVAWTEEKLKGNRRIGALQEVFSSWAGKDPDAAVAWLKTISSGAEKYQVASENFYLLAWTAPQLAADLAKDIGENNFDGWAVNSIGGQLAGLDIERAISLLESFETPSFKQKMRRGVVDAWASSDPEKALAFVQQHPNESERTELLGEVLESLAYYEPEKALAVAEGLPVGKEQTKALESVIESWTRRSPEDAAAYVKSLTDPLVQQATLKKLLSYWSYRDGEAAAKYALTLEPSKAVESGVSNAMSQWASRNPEGALEFLANQPHNSVTGKALSATLTSWAKDYPEKAANALTSGALTNPQYDHFKTLANTWASKDSAAALQWAETIGDAEHQAGAFAAISSKWAKDDPQATGSWIGGMAEGTQRDHATQSFAKATFAADPENSLNWAVTITEPSRQWDVIRDLGRQWHELEREAAGAWMNEQGFSAEEVRLITEPK